MVILLSTLASPIARARAEPPSPADFYRLLSRAATAMEQKRYGAAAPLYRKLLEGAPDNGDLWLSYYVATARAGETREALAASEKAFGLGFGSAPMAYEIAQQHAQLGAKANALVWLERALAARLSPRTRMQTDPAFAAYRDDDRFRELAGFLPKRTFSRDEGWRYDLAFVESEAKRLHPSPRREAFAPELAAAMHELSESVPRLTDHQIVVELTAAMALLHDGHVWVLPPSDFKTLPVDFYFFSDGVYVVAGTGQGKGLVGSRVLKLGARTPEQIIAGLPRFISRDNAMGIKRIGAGMLENVDFLQALGGTDNPDRATLTIRDRAGAVRTVTLDGGPWRDMPATRRLRVPEGAPGEAPLYLQSEAPYWLAPLPDARAVYFQFNGVWQIPFEPTIADFAATLKKAVGDPAVKNLIVDVRHNGGGDTNLLPPLLRALCAFQEAAPDHRIFYVAGRATFSAAQNFSTDVERLTKAIFVGEPTGSSPNFVGEGPMFFELPYTHVQMSISNRYHQHSDWTDSRFWIAPAIPAPLSSAQYFANRDPALEAIEEVIRRDGR